MAEQNDADDAPETGPLRRCVVTRERLAKDKMIRFVVGPDRRIVPDLAARLPGRGIWLSARGDVIETARTRGAFAKAARGPVTVPPDLTSGLQVALARRIVDTLGLARRAGQAVCGFAKAREWLDTGRAALVVQARDGSADERARFLGGWGQRLPVVAPLDAASLGAVFGRDHVVHVAVASGRLAETLRIEAERLAGVEQVIATDATEPAHASGNGAARRRERTSPPGHGGRIGDPPGHPDGSGARNADEGAGE
ncbi:RNA-binding protein [Rhodovastum sp. RN2-1]|uniref:RNA-binding protein n=1 Tax=Limobrevibacterium gyesilva TaxID=2991712 RepID=A0AA42CHC6_9PROT|nr:RNA-binding protein [Limobrevibacterium gyesilva]